MASQSFYNQGQQQQQPTLCGGVWIHQEYRDLRDRYEQVLQDLAEANAKLAALPPVLAPGASTAGSSKQRANHSSHQANAISQHQVASTSSIGNAIPGGFVTNLATPPDPAVLATYRAQIGTWQRPVYLPDELFLVPNYGKEHAKSTKLQGELYDQTGQAPDDSEWKVICKDRKLVAGELLDKDRTWTAQRDDIVDVCVSWLEKKHPRLALCDESRWKAVNVLKARFEEARKPVTAGTRIRKRVSDVDDDDDEIDPALTGASTNGSDALKAKAKAGKRLKKELDIPV